MTVTRGRGRPKSADAGVIAIQALRVLDARGYRECTMADVAAEAGISIRTLHRYFPAKADIVWGPVDISFQSLRQRLDETPVGMPLARALREGIIASFSDHPEDKSTTRLRMRLIGRTPELRANSSEPFRRWRQSIVDFVAERTGSDPLDLLPTVAGSAVQVTTMSALVWWATNIEAGDPDVAVAEALDALGAGFSAAFAR